VVACEGCGHPLPADATFCAHCGRAVEASQAEAEAEAYADTAPEPEPEPEQAADETFLRAADPWER
jgi:uncharacterized Zn finger protein (UPF0148 family)